jgi:hypothetical protein
LSTLTSSVKAARVNAATSRITWVSIAVLSGVGLMMPRAASLRRDFDGGDN